MVKLSTINLKSLYVIYITEAIILEVEVNTKMALGLGYFPNEADATPWGLFWHLFRSLSL